jgi:hypothetical protein
MSAFRSFSGELPVLCRHYGVSTSIGWPWLHRPAYSHLAASLHIIAGVWKAIQPRE